MFEESLLESQAAPVSITKRWTMAGSTALQVALAALIIALPLFHPEQISFHVSVPLTFTPPPPKPPLPVRPVKSTIPQTSAAPSISANSRPLLPSLHPSVSEPDSPDITNLNPIFGTNNAVPPELAAIGSHQQVSAATPKQPQRLKVSDGVSAGLLMTPIRPIYPAIARAARISGKVVVEAIISKTGMIESLHVISGPEMLRPAALDAIRAARYQPFLLNKEPIEVQTTITVDFTLGG